MRPIQSIASAIALFLLLSTSSFAQSCSGSVDFASGYSSYSSPMMYSSYSSPAPMYDNAQSYYPSVMSSSISYGTIGAPMMTSAPAYPSYTGPTSYPTTTYSQPPAYSSSAPYPSMPAPTPMNNVFTAASYSAPASSYMPAPVFSPAPTSSCANGNCSQPGSGGNWNFGF
ncbi:MAG: hypothetical protein AB8G99_09585 [Planctomycetaceae bacterium]